MEEQAIKEIAFEIAEKAKSLEEALKIKKEIAKNFKLSRIPSNVEILQQAKGTEFYEKLREVLRLKPVRSLSGIVVIAVMSSPAPCPHGKCVPCPGGVEFDSPQSYTGLEPAAQRGRQYCYDPYTQVYARLKELSEIGHDVEKAELIVMGGTFLARDKNYKENFILGIFNALNTFGSRSKMESSVEKAKKKNEHAKVRCVGLTFETRPDYAREEHILEMLKYGATRVELGVQSIYDEVLLRIQRGHSVADTIKATKLLKDSAFKVCYHMMPGLPGSDFERDLKSLREIFSNPAFRPDYLKIYPTVVVKGTKLYEMWERGEYSPYSTEEVVELIARAKLHFPEWVRVQRIQRDIPVHAAIGLKAGNIRQLVHRRLRELGGECRCIRCREVGHKGVKEEEWKKAELKITEYEASGGKEFFIAYEIPEHDALVGFIRLRFPSEPFIEVLKDCALIRELHVYGKATPLGKVQASISSSLLFIPIFAKEIGATDIEIGLISSAYSLSTFIASSIFGRLSDFYSRKKILLLGLLLSAFSFFAQCLVTTPLQLLAVRAFIGFSIGIFPAALVSYAYERNRNVGYFSAFGSLGWATGQLLAGIIMIYYGIFAFGALLFFFAFLIVLKENVPGQKIERARSSLAIVKQNFSIYFAFFIRHVGASAVWLIFPIYLAELGISKFWIGVIYFTNSFLQFIIMQRIERFNPNLLLNAGTVFSGLAFLFYAFATQFYEFLAIQILIAIGWSAMYVGSLKIVLESGVERSTSAGFLNSTIYLSTIVGSMLGGLIAENYGYKDCLYFGAILSFLALLARIKK